jgi:hypothetical protein
MAINNSLAAEALFAARCEAYPRYDLGRFESHVNLKMEAICSSEMSVLTTATWYKVPEERFN